ncbi:MAG: tetratricopeptide repeat protein [Candidatus Heimdallarchaeota archaeon]
MNDIEKIKKDIRKKKNVNELIHIAQQFGQRKQYDMVMFCLFRAKELEPKNRLVLSSIAYGYFIQRRFLKAIDAYKEFISIHRPNADELQLYGASLGSWGDLLDAQEVLEEAMKLNPTPGIREDFELIKSLILKRGNLIARQHEEYRKSENFLAIDEEFKKKVDETDDIEKLNSINKEECKDSDHKRIYLFERRLKLNPKDAGELANVAVYLLNFTPRKEQAIFFMRQTVKLEPNDSGKWGFLAFLYEQYGDIEKAFLAAERALELNPEDEQNVLYYQRIEVVYQMAKQPGFMEFLQKELNL